MYNAYPVIILPPLSIGYFHFIKAFLLEEEIVGIAGG